MALPQGTRGGGLDPRPGAPQSPGIRLLVPGDAAPRCPIAPNARPQRSFLAYGRGGGRARLPPAALALRALYAHLLWSVARLHALLGGPFQPLTLAFIWAGGLSKFLRAKGCFGFVFLCFFYLVENFVLPKRASSSLFKSLFPLSFLTLYRLFLFTARNSFSFVPFC